jgi:hypothetical protein
MMDEKHRNLKKIQRLNMPFFCLCDYVENGHELGNEQGAEFNGQPDGC